MFIYDHMPVRSYTIWFADSITVRSTNINGLTVLLQVFDWIVCVRLIGTLYRIIFTQKCGEMKSTSHIPMCLCDGYLIWYMEFPFLCDSVEFLLISIDQFWNSHIFMLMNISKSISSRTPIIIIIIILIPAGHCSGWRFHRRAGRGDVRSGLVIWPCSAYLDVVWRGHIMT